MEVKRCDHMQVDFRGISANATNTGADSYCEL